MSFKKTSEGRIFFQNSGVDNANDEPLAAAKSSQRPTGRRADVPPADTGPTQLQILALLRSLNEKLKATQVERNAMRIELDEYRQAIDALQSKPQVPNPADHIAEEVFKELEDTRKLLLDLEERQAGIEREHKSNSEKIRIGVGSYRDLIKRMDAADQKQEDMARLVNETAAQQTKITRQIEKAIEDRTRFMRKIERIEETVIQTRDALNAKAMVLLTDQNIAGAIPADLDTSFPQSRPGVPTALPEEKEASPSSINSRAFQATAIILLLIGGIIAGWAVSALQSPQASNSGEFQITSDTDVATPAQNTADQAAITAANEDVDAIVNKWSVSEDTSAFGPAQDKADEIPAPSAINPADDIGTLDLNDTQALEKMLEDNPDALASELNKIEPGSEDIQMASLPMQETAYIDQDNPVATNANATPLAQGPAVHELIKSDTGLPAVVQKIEARAFEGMPEAQHDLAAIYTAGHQGVAQNFKRAMFWFEQSAKNGVANAAYNLGVLHHQGLGTTANLKQAIEWYIRAADMGHPEAQYNLGIAYIEGVGVEYDPFKANDYFQKAAAQGIMEASYNLGLIYENGLLGKAQPDEALVWYKDASDKGSPEAKAALEQLAKTLGIGMPEINRVVDNVKLARKGGQGNSVTPPVKQNIRSDNNVGSETAILAQIQEKLMQLGLYPGPADGSDSPLSQDAIRAYQSLKGLESNGEPSAELLVHMLSEENKAPAENQFN